MSRVPSAAALATFSPATRKAATGVRRAERRLAHSRLCMARIEQSPAWNGRTRQILVDAVDAEGRPVLDEQGQQVREAVRIPRTMQQQHRYYVAKRRQQTARLEMYHTAYAAAVTANLQA